MKTIGLIGGMSWESTAEYYRMINQGVSQRLGGLHSAKCVLVSVDFAEIEALQRSDDWEEALQVMIAAAKQVEQGGGEFLLICTNTMHKLADDMQKHISIPILHIADPTAEAICRLGLEKIGLLGTRFTMEQDFYIKRLQAHGLSVVVPSPDERALVHRVIYDELCLGKILPESRASFRLIMQNLGKQGAQGIILGCTEIGLLVQGEDSPVPLFDTTRLHAEAAVEAALKDT